MDGTIGVMGISRAVMHIKKLSCLGNGIKKRVVAFGTFFMQFQG